MQRAIKSTNPWQLLPTHHVYNALAADAGAEDDLAAVALLRLHR